MVVPGNSVGSRIVFQSGQDAMGHIKHRQALRQAFAGEQRCIGFELRPEARVMGRKPRRIDIAVTNDAKVVAGHVDAPQVTAT